METIPYATITQKGLDITCPYIISDALQNEIDHLLNPWLEGTDSIGGCKGYSLLDYTITLSGKGFAITPPKPGPQSYTVRGFRVTPTLFLPPNAIDHLAVVLRANKGHGLAESTTATLGTEHEVLQWTKCMIDMLSKLKAEVRKSLPCG